MEISNKQKRACAATQWLAGYQEHMSAGCCQDQTHPVQTAGRHVGTLCAQLRTAHSFLQNSGR